MIAWNERTAWGRQELANSVEAYSVPSDTQRSNGSVPIRRTPPRQPGMAQPARRGTRVPLDAPLPCAQMRGRSGQGCWGMCGSPATVGLLGSQLGNVDLPLPLCEAHLHEGADEIQRVAHTACDVVV